MKKPKWVVQKEQQKKAASQETIWLFGIHAVQDALRNPQREKLRLVKYSLEVVGKIQIQQFIKQQQQQSKKEQHLMHHQITQEMVVK